MPFPSPGDFPDPGTEALSPSSPALQADSLPTEPVTIYHIKEGKVAQLCPTLSDPIDYTVHETLQARILEWVHFPFSRGSSQPRDQTQVSQIAGGFFTSWATRETHIKTILSSFCLFIIHQENVSVGSFPLYFGRVKWHLGS